MGKHNVVSGVLVLVVILMITISTLMVVNYISGVLNAAVAFATTDQIDKLTGCGVNVPAELLKLKVDIPSFLLPAVYVGLPGLMIIIAILMFIAGYYYGTGGEESSSETTTSISSPNRSSTGKYKPGRRVEKIQTEKSSSSKDM